MQLLQFFFSFIMSSLLDTLPSFLPPALLLSLVSSVKVVQWRRDVFVMFCDKEKRREIKPAQLAVELRFQTAGVSRSSLWEYLCQQPQGGTIKDNNLTGRLESSGVLPGDDDLWVALRALTPVPATDGPFLNQWQHKNKALHRMWWQVRPIKSKFWLEFPWFVTARWDCVVLCWSQFKAFLQTWHMGRNGSANWRLLIELSRECGRCLSCKKKKKIQIQKQKTHWPPVWCATPPSPRPT